MPQRRNGDHGPVPPDFAPTPPRPAPPDLPEGASEALSGALGLIAALGGSGIGLAPREPTARMLAAGADTAGISIEEARRVWRAMLGAVD